MNLFQCLAIFAILACYAQPLHSQRFSRQQAPANYCVTPENYYGTCATLSYCPQIANVFQTLNPRQAQQYVILSQRACGTRSVNGDPVVCCTRPIAPTTSRPQRQTQRPPVSINPNNPFINPTPPPPVTSAPATQRPITISPTPPPATTSRPTTSASVIDNRATVCRGPDTKEGTCINLKDCPVLLNRLLSNQNDPTFAEFLRASNSICGGAQSSVCCPSQQQQLPTSSPLIIKSNDDIPRRLPTLEEGCGNSNNSFKKIVGGEVSKIGAWPWVALIGYDDELSATPFKCGGTLITARHVLTAAHCLRKDLSFVRLGEHDLNRENEAKHIDIKVVRSERHPDYNSRNGHSDLALLYLERNVVFTDFISAICMPLSNQLRQKSYVKFMPFVVGWGKTMEGGDSSNVLQELQIPIYDNSVCRDRYQKQNRLFTDNQFDSAVLCAGVLSGGKDTCQGDSGGPLMIPEVYQSGFRFYLLGVVSYGIGCARPEIPGVYTSTQYFMDWIIQKVAETN